MTDCTSLSFEFPACRKRRVEADYSGGDISSNGGVLLLRQADRLTATLAPANAFYSHFIIVEQNKHSHRPRSGPEIFILFFAQNEIP